MRVMLTTPEQIDRVFEELMGVPLDRTLTPRQAQIQAQVDDWVANGPKIMRAAAEVDSLKVPNKCGTSTVDKAARARRDRQRSSTFFNTPENLARRANRQAVLAEAEESPT